MDDLHKIHVTEIGGCTRKLCHRHKKSKAMEPHALTAKGTLTHKAIESMITKVQFPLAHESKERLGISPSIYAKLLPDVNSLASKALEWLEVSNIGDNMVCEQTFNYSIGDGYVITGTPDLYTDKVLVDFKTGSRHLRSHLDQVGTYAHILRDIDGKERDAILVYLGGDDIKQVTKSYVDLKPHYDAVMASIEEEKRLRSRIIDSNWGGVCKSDFLCVFCPYRHRCNGL